MSTRPGLFLIDGNSYIYRAFFAIRNLSNSKGLPTNAVYGFTSMLLKIVREHRPDYLAIAFDSKGPTIRHEQFEAYKAQRPEMPDTLQTQIPYIHRMVEAFRIPVVIMDGFEADDLIGTLAAQGEGMGMEVTIVSGDKDMYQLITPNVRVYDTMKDKLYGSEEIHERFGVDPIQVVDIMGLMGDSIDNIPGVPGIGEKTATDLIRRFGSVEALLGRLEEVEKPKLRENLRHYSEQARMSRELAAIRRDCPVTLDSERYRRSEPDAEALIALFRELEFTSFLKQVEIPRARASGPVTIVSTEEALSEAANHLQSSRQLALYFWIFPREEGRREILGLSLSTENRSFYIPLTHRYLGSPPNLSAATVFERLTPVFQDGRVRKIGHDLKPVFLVCRKQGCPLEEPVADTMVASYLINPNRKDHGLETAALEQAGLRLDPAPELTPLVSVEALAAAGRDRTDALVRLDAGLSPALKEQGLDRLFQEVEMPLVEILAEMEEVGFKLDVGALKTFSGELEAQLSGMVRRIHALAGTEFNINSPKQLAEILFEKLGLTPIKKTKTGFSTNEDVLQQLAVQHELPAEILNYRQLTKLKSTYVDALPILADPATRRLHTSLNQTVTATGRLSSSDPNLQNIPVKGEWGQRMRRAFIAEEGWRLLSGDYNQVELRVLAHLSKDENLTADFKEGRDVHRTTAAQLFAQDPDRITPEMRRTAKTVNFGIIYGISPFGLSTTLGISQAEAKKYIDRYLDHYEGVRRFMEATIAEAREKGYVTTILSRRRPIPDLDSPIPAARGFAERAAINTPIQGSAADLIKLAMIAIAQRLKKEGRRSRMILQIHDELILEVPEDELDAMKGLVRDAMEGVMELSVPLQIDLGVGSNWSEAHA